MKIKIEIRTNDFEGPVVLDEVKKALRNIGYEENKQYLIACYNPKKEEQK